MTSSASGWPRRLSRSRSWRDSGIGWARFWGDGVLGCKMTAALGPTSLHKRVPKLPSLRDQRTEMGVWMQLFPRVFCVEFDQKSTRLKQWVFVGCVWRCTGRIGGKIGGLAGVICPQSVGWSGEHVPCVSRLGCLASLEGRNGGEKDDLE